MKNHRDLTKGSIVKNIWVLALPMMLSSLLQTFLNIIDMFWVGKLGSSAIAAVAMSGAIVMVITVFIIGLGRGTSAMISRFVGAKQIEEANMVAMQSFFLGLVTAFILAIAGYVLAPFLFNMLSVDYEVFYLGTGYIRIIFLGGISMVLLFLINAIFYGAGNSIVPMIIVLIATIVNIILDPLMIFGVGFFPEMGVRGAALSTVLAQGLGASVGLCILLKKRSLIHINLRKSKINFNIINRLLKVGFPASLQMSLRSMMGLVLMGIVAQYGTYAIAAYGIGLRLQMMVLTPGFGLGNAAATLVGQNLGANKAERAEKSAWTITGIYMLIMGIIGSVFFIFSYGIIAIFTKNVEVINIGSQFIRMTALIYVFIALGLILSRALMGAGDTISPMFITLFSLWGLQVPLAIFLPKVTNLGVTGVFWAILIASILHGLMTAVWFKTGKWKLKKI